MTEWLRRNRWGLVALPVTLALAVAANAQRLQDYWWDSDLRTVGAAGRQGEWVTWSDTFTDAAGEGTRTFSVRVAAVEPTDTAQSFRGSEDVALPGDLAAVRVAMDFRAAPDQVLFGCRLALVDTAGNRYVYRPLVGGVMQSLHPCLPEQTGPRPSISAGEPRVTLSGEQRPPEWEATPVVLVPRGTEITKVLLWWEQPDYLEVRLD